MSQFDTEKAMLFKVGAKAVFVSPKSGVMLYTQDGKVVKLPAYTPIGVIGYGGNSVYVAVVNNSVISYGAVDPQVITAGAKSGTWTANTLSGLSGTSTDVAADTTYSGTTLAIAAAATLAVGYWLGKKSKK